METHGALTAGRLVDTKSGYFSAIYKDANTGELFYVNRGTDNRPDIAADALQAYGHASVQYDIAIDNAQRLVSGNVTITFEGHSLGGGLATAQAVVSGYRATVFNPAAVHPNTVGGAAILARQNSLVTNITVNGELLSYWQDKPGGILSAGGRRVPLDPANWERTRAYNGSSSVSANINPFDNHSTTTVLDSIFYRYENGKGF